MTEGINLAEKQTTARKNRNPFTSASIILVIVVLVVVGGLFAYSLFLKSSLAALLAQEDQQIQKLTSLTPEKTKILTIQERLTAIQRILDKRQELSSNFDAIGATIPSGVLISDITTTNKGLSVKLAADNLEALNTFLEERLPKILQDKNVKLKKIDISDFSFQRGASGYSTTIAFSFL